MFFYHQSLQSCFGKDIIDNIGRRLPEEINTNTKQNSIEDARDENPLPKPVFYDKTVCFKICLYGYDKFFKQFAGWVSSNLENIIRVSYFSSTFNINLYVEKNRVV